jgi:hypothetical protein
MNETGRHAYMCTILSPKDLDTRRAAVVPLGWGSNRRSRTTTKEGRLAGGGATSAASAAGLL